MDQNKENNIFRHAMLKDMPQTPNNLLKRTHSKLKTGIAKDIQGGNVINTSPQKRLPLASKDNNRSNSFLNNSNVNLNFNINNNNNNNNNNINNNNIKKQHIFQQNKSGILADDRKLKKYGSVLGYNALPKVKSLVLKDISDNEDDDDDLLSLKLRDSMNKKSINTNKSNSGIGLLSGGNLQQLIRDANEDVREIEHKSNAFPDKEYIPDDHLPFDENDIAKLKTFNSPFKLEQSNSDDEEDSSELLLLANTSDDEGTHNDKITTNKNLSINNKPNSKDVIPADILDIEPSYGEGLDSNDLEDLLDL
ncbi:hypothetical protein Kpol_543p41 [Vanderwaltozyma polyspora DSM 70294]|uniref:Securin n=1 Tax=Vanderwaltozyma polyspora (strain ATCC 22028 / DSM 70294 / BCRC 21397 / CBS 2163 / NBRC 10782 / NRRL Y-8283 / UCD 57-17) TaxID=436907 RepID=A7THP5_VANPO|nr:uncharacterized protein Kpol_543p41 [Vanderwaltozyma polyspora DSM 70294]EDO18211.1 hypothetical protein Kpol_543p41 [Vanderwaltozyma polyspora DSM 70294]